ncbi:MAG: hypothetical protein ACT4O9_13605 [Blastocatellia bacterium]
MFKTRSINEKPFLFRRLVWAVLGGTAAFVLASQFLYGLFPALEFLIAAGVVYFIARR